jgi:hypothetical protein
MPVPAAEAAPIRAGDPSPRAAASDDREREHLRAATIPAIADAVRRQGGEVGADPRSGAERSPDPRSSDPRPAVERSPEEPRASCTVAQLRRFIKSRPWVPMHELRRRFGINGVEDDVTPIRVGDARLFVGLPPAEGALMAELLGGGDVGYELSLDPGAPIVVGVYPMRPVPRG